MLETKRKPAKLLIGLSSYQQKELSQCILRKSQVRSQQEHFLPVNCPAGIEGNKALSLGCLTWAEDDELVGILCLLLALWPKTNLSLVWEPINDRRAYIWILSGNIFKSKSILYITELYINASDYHFHTAVEDGHKIYNCYKKCLQVSTVLSWASLLTIWASRDSSEYKNTHFIRVRVHAWCLDVQCMLVESKMETTNSQFSPCKGNTNTKGRSQRRDLGRFDNLVRSLISTQDDNYGFTAG